MLDKKFEVKGKKGVSPVVATVIISAIVIAVGGAMWSYSQGAATVIANDYINNTMTLLNEVIERYSIEHVYNNSDGSLLSVYIYNYGDVDIVVDLYANSTTSYNSTLGTTIDAGDITKIIIHFSTMPLQSGDEVALKAHTRRQNNEYYTYYVP